MTALEFPIQIGLVGAPDSGKRAVAEAFKEISADWFAENGSELEILRNSGDLIEERDGQAMGLLGAWSDDLQAYFERYRLETEARQSEVSWISLGTALDNIAHCGINLENIMTGLQTPDQEQRIQRQQVTMTTLTFLFLERFRYLFGFYVPYEGTSIVLPGQPEPSNYSPRIDMALRTIFANFGLRIQALDQPTVEEKAQEMFDTVRRIMENGPELPPQPELPPHEEGEPETISDPIEPMDPELEAQLAEQGIEFPAWEPTIPQSEDVTITE